MRPLSVARVRKQVSIRGSFEVLHFGVSFLVLEEALLEEPLLNTECSLHSKWLLDENRFLR